MGIDKQKNWIFFDLDDTLIPSSAIYQACYKTMKLNDDKVFIQARANVKKVIQPGHTSVHNRLLYFKEYLNLKSAFSSKKLMQLNARYEGLLGKYVASYVKKSNRQGLLKHLSKKYSMAIVTNETCRTQMVKIQELDPSGKLFQCVVTSEEVGAAKPSPLIFNHVLKLTKANPKQTIFVGDDFNNDIQPALAMGMAAVLTEEFEKSKADLVKDSKMRLIDHLSQLESNLI